MTGGVGQPMPHTADGVPDTKAPTTHHDHPAASRPADCTARSCPARTRLVSIGADRRHRDTAAHRSERSDRRPTQDNEIVHSWALAPAGTEEAGGVGNRSNLSYTADPGTVLEDAVTLYNLSNVPLVFRIYATDAFNTDDGDFDLLAADEIPVGVGSWVDMGAEQVPVDANTQVTIPITITIPENAAPGDYVGAVLASNAAESTGPDGQRFTPRSAHRDADHRAGQRRPHRRPRHRRHLDRLLRRRSTRSSGSATVTYTIENRGNVSLDGTAQVSIGGPLGLAEQKGAPTDIPLLLPGGSVTLTEEFDSVPAFGVAVTKVQLDPTDDGDVAVSGSSQQSITFAPPIALLLLLLALLFGLLALRAYRRHQQRDAAVSPEVQEDADAEREPEHQPT